MSEDTPKTVSDETSFELSEFLSESDIAPETEPAAETPSHALATVPATPPAPVPPVEVTALPAPAAIVEERHEPAPSRPATITEFPVRSHMPAAVALPSLPGPVTLVDLIERRGGFDWREAVAVIHQICLYLRSQSPQSPILLDPRNIQISEKGEVRLLSGQSSSDPLVIQVGRLLRTMLMGREAPPELRLLLAQATFELPIFESIEDVDRALAQLNKLDEPGPAGLALLRAVAAPPPPPEINHAAINRPASTRTILPARDTAGRRSRSQRRAPFGGYGSHVGIIFTAIAVIAALLWTRPTLLFPTEAAPAPNALSTAAVESATTPPPTPTPTAGVGGAPTEPKGSSESARTHTTVSPAPRPMHVRDRAGVAIATPIETRTSTSEPTQLPPLGPRATATVGLVRPPAAAVAPAPSLRDSERRATSLLQQGQAAAASMAFDSLVMSNPLYEPKTTDLTPEALGAFRTSQRLLLPIIAQRNYDRARSTLDAGDADRALAIAKDTLVIIDRRRADTPAALREQVQDLIDKATAAIAAQDEIVYTEADTDVIPPQQLTRQMPVTGPIGVPANRVGWLEMIIARDGTVENVRLHTPLNRHHERMIVSPAKAWKYRPATRNGRPVRYRILVKVNLPESGTEF